MEDNQIDLLFKVLKILDDEGVLEHLIIVGSWCIYFYGLYFRKKHPIATLRTRDVDFLVPEPKALMVHLDLPELLKPLGFLVEYRGNEGYIRLVHPEIFIEFLVPQKGRGIDRAFPLSNLGLNAQALRFMDVLFMETVDLNVKGITIKLPHPVCFTLHKIIIFTRRSREKRKKEVEQIDRMLDLLKKEDRDLLLRRFFNRLHPKWQKRVINNLISLGKDNIVELLR